VRAEDVLGRLDGDTFIVALCDVGGVAEATDVANRILNSIAVPFVIVGEHTLSITASIGISVFPKDGIDGDTLVRLADAAMYQAKKHGRNRLFINGDDARAVVATTQPISSKR
jgi:diguanylate cyclase (GGDEF)-like protein